MDKINRPTDEEISEYFKFCAKDAGYSENCEMVEIAISAARAMFDGKFDLWKSNKESDDFWKQYHENHKRCPNCGGERYSSTLVAYILNMDDKENYKDKNHIECVACGFKGITHDLVK